MANVTENICAMVNKELVEEILKIDYGFINGKIRQLDGYDDKNYHITVCIKIFYKLNFIANIFIMGTYSKLIIILCSQCIFFYDIFLKNTLFKLVHYNKILTYQHHYITINTININNNYKIISLNDHMKSLFYLVMFI